MLIARVALLTATVTAVLLGFPHSADAVVLRHDRDLARSVELAGRFDATGRFGADGNCTLIRPTWVVTAAHVAGSVSAFNRQVRFGDAVHEIRRVIPHPAAGRGGMSLDSVDLALVELAAPVEGVTPVALFPGDDERGRMGFIVGTGDFGAGSLGPGRSRLTPSDAVRRAVTNTIDRAERGRLFVSFTAPPEGTDLEGVSGPGDSGGPLYLQTDAGVFLAGVSSASFGGPPERYGVTDTYVRVSDHAEWIASEIASPSVEVIAAEPARRIDAAGFPDTEAGRCAGDFFQAFSTGEVTALASFGEHHRSASARAERSSEAWAALVHGLRDRWGALEPHSCTTNDDRLVVLARAARDGSWRQVTFMLPADAIRDGAAPGAGRLEGVAFQPAAPPR